MNTDLMFSSKSNEWETPQDFFDILDHEFHFTLDPCCTDLNHKCSFYFTKKDNGLVKSWFGHRVFCNPPYGVALKDWVRKAYNERNNAELIVMLIPSRTDTSYFHDYIYHKAEIRFIKGRLRFGNAKNYAPFPSMLVIFRKGDFDYYD